MANSESPNKDDKLPPKENMLSQSEKIVSRIEHSLTSLKGNVEEMSASTINRILDRLDKAGSMLTDVFIAEDRGYELPSETFQLSDPLATLYQQLHDARTLLRNEISRRYGPGAPSRLPLGRRSR